MNVIKKPFGNDGPILIEPTIFKDDRGYFYESFNEKEFMEKVANISFVQDNQSCSHYGVLRGLHMQKPPYAQAKLVRVVSGAVYDVAVDVRKGSPTYGQWTGAYLSEENQRSFFIPQGFAHGFLSLRDNTVFQYKCDNYYNKESEAALIYNDSDININWFEWIPWGKIKMSTKDMMGALQLKDFDSPFEYKG